WNSTVDRVQLRVVRDSTVPIGDNNGYNNVFFSSSVYGRSFGPGTLAVTTNWYRANTRVEADVIFNTSFPCNSYAGPLRQGPSGGMVFDIRRVALHEFGHVLGLDHPDQHGQSVRAIMNTSVTDLDRLTDDDVVGARALYGEPSPTTTTSRAPCAAAPAAPS